MKPREWLEAFRTAATRPVPATGLAIFRVAYSLVLLAEVAQMFYFRRLIFDPIPFLQTTDNSIDYALAAWAAALVCLALGWMTRTACVVNYVMTLLTFSTFHANEYHIDYIYTSLNALLPFVPLSTVWSLDRRGRKPDSDDRSTVPCGYYYALIIVGLGLPYFDSAIHKLGSPMWRDGLGLWMPASFPQVAWIGAQAVFDQAWLMKLLSHLTVAFELLFMFVLWWRPARLLLIPIGVGLHLGIGVLFPIPLFAAGVLSLYILMAQVTWPKSTPAAEVSLPLPRRVGSSLVWTGAITAIIVAAQTVLTARTPLAVQAAETLGVEAARSQATAKLAAWTRWTGPLLGVRIHSVFMHTHFYQHQESLALQFIRPDGTTQTLPISGDADLLSSGRVWVRWTFRVSGPEVELEERRAGMRDYTAFWCQKNDVSLSDAEFAIVAKSFAASHAWQPDLRRRRAEQPWRRVGSVAWRDGVCRVEFAEDDRRGERLAGATVYD